jgi:hypothetical protein
MFEVLTGKNSATVTLNNNITGHSETVLTGRGPEFIAFAVLAFAKRHRIMVADVSYSVVTKGGT